MCLLLTYLLTAVPSILTPRQILIHKSFNRFATAGLPVAEWAIETGKKKWYHQSIHKPFTTTAPLKLTILSMVVLMGFLSNYGGFQK